jgi:GTP diphosphokinase / guanosine-3',5'-bis(diphosphate) 3'-diphosphatase
MGVTIKSIIDSAQTYIFDLDSDRLNKAYEFALKAHEGQVRFSGEPYVAHPLEAASLLLPLKPDEDTLIATLLHDVSKGANVSLQSIEKTFGSSVVQLIRGVEKLGLIKLQEGETQADTWRKMFLSMAKDLRVVFIKLAERLHNMKTLQYVPIEKQKRIAQETLFVYAPIASRLGIYSMKSQLEDYCFKYLYPREYQELKVQIDAHGQVNDQLIKEAEGVLTQLLKDEGIEAEVSGRIKHLYSIYRKLRKKNSSSIDSVYDLFAMRIVVTDQFREGFEFVGHCYTVLGAVHNRWTPMPGRFKDYIAVPKINGYRSLHTTVIGVSEVLKNQPIEVQIRTDSMHQEAEFGIASHWWYEDSRRASANMSREEVQTVIQERRLVSKFHDLLEKFPKKRADFERFLSPEMMSSEADRKEILNHFRKDGGFTDADVGTLKETIGSRRKGNTQVFKHQVDWLHGLERLHEDLNSGMGSQSSMKVNIFQDRIFVLTPQGDVKDLPVGATPVDFAYSVHSDLGDRCHQSKVNGSIVSLDCLLKNGDVVEIIGRKEPQPNRYWLSFVKTNHAKQRIKAWFRSVDREKNVREGRDIINKELKRLGKGSLGPNYNLLAMYGGSKLKFADRENIVEMVGNGTMTVNNVVRTVFSEDELLGKKVVKKAVHRPKVDPKPSAGVREDVLITGEDNLPITLSACCSPRHPVAIIGVVTRGRTIRVHVKECRELSDIEPQRLLEATWAVASDEVPQYQVKVQIHADDRVGLLRDIIQVVADMDMNIVDFPLVSKESGVTVRNLIVEAPGYDDLAKLFYGLERLDGVHSVQKL